MHVVRAGETLASIAKHYYGKENKEKVLVRENSLFAYGGSKIIPGVRLVIPHVSYHRVEKGETWRSIADHYYGAPTRAFILLDFNKAKPGLQPDPGSVIIVPYPLRHVAEGRESYKDLSTSYYGSADHVGRIKRFNKKTGKGLTRGELVLVPVIDLKLSSAGKAATSEEKQKKKGESGAREGDLQFQEDAKSGIEKVRSMAREGRYVAALALGNQLVAQGMLSEGQKVSLHLELARGYLALGEKDLALDSASLILRLRPRIEFEEARISPKLRRLFERARAKIKTSSKDS